MDENGVQLPYIDKVVMGVGSGDLISAKTGTGESDLQFTNLDFADYTFLKNAEKRYPIKVDLWKRTQGARIALMPNLNCKDLVWRQVLLDVRVRRALSLAINREEINKAVFLAWLRLPPMPSCPKVRCSSRNIAMPGPGSTPIRPMRCWTRRAWSALTGMAFACCRMGARRC